MEQDPAKPLSKVDVQEIMGEIKADIDAKGLDGGLVSFEDIPNEGDRWCVYPADNFDEKLATRYVTSLNLGSMVALDRPLDPDKKKFFKRVMRKMTRFYVQPAVDDQNAVNVTITNALYQLLACVEEQNKEIAELKKAVYELERNQAENAGSTCE